MVAKPVSAISVLPPDGALVPLAQEEIRDEAGRGVDDDTGEREQHQRGEEARDVEAELGLEQPEGEAGIAARGTGRELGDDGGDQGEAAGDAEPGEEERQRVGDLEVEERLPAPGAVEL